MLLKSLRNRRPENVAETEAALSGAPRSVPEAYARVESTNFTRGMTVPSEILWPPLHVEVP